MTVGSVPLRFHRARGAVAAGAAPILGERRVGVGGLAMAPLGPSAGAAWADAWSAGPDVRTGRHGCVAWASDGHFLHGTAEVDDVSHPGGLRGASEQAYADLFAVLAASGTPHLLRLWNYLAGINVETADGERYRQFNAGRQQAFLDAQRSAFEGSPAACALGTQGGPLHVSFLAGRVAPLAIENPRQVSAYHYPPAYGPRSPTFSRAALAEVGAGVPALFVSGTASIVGHETLHVGDVRAQTRESLANIAVLREVAGQRAGRAFPAEGMVYTVYVRRPEDVAAVQAEFESSVSAEALYVQADICRANLLVEIECHALPEVAP